MKKTIILLLTATAFFSTSSHAQKATFGFQGGANMQKFVGKSTDGSKVTNDFVKGAHVGFNVEIPICRGFYIQPGLQFITKGTKNETSLYTSTANLYYLEMPIYFVVKPQAGKGHLIIGVGSEVSYGLGGKWKYEDALYPLKNKNADVKFKNTVTPADDPVNTLYIAPLDVSIAAIFGYEFKNSFFLQVNGQYGLLNRIPKHKSGDPLNKAELKNIGFGITVGHRF